MQHCREFCHNVWPVKVWKCRSLAQVMLQRPNCPAELVQSTSNSARVARLHDIYYVDAFLPKLCNQQQLRHKSCNLGTLEIRDTDCMNSAGQFWHSNVSRASDRRIQAFKGQRATRLKHGYRMAQLEVFLFGVFKIWIPSKTLGNEGLRCSLYEVSSANTNPEQHTKKNTSYCTLSCNTVENFATIFGPWKLENADHSLKLCCSVQIVPRNSCIPYQIVRGWWDCMIYIIWTYSCRSRAINSNLQFV